MALDAAQYKELIAQELGDTSDLMLTSIGLYWEMHDGLDDHPRYLQAKLAAIDLLLGQPNVREAVDYSEDGQSQSLSQMFKHLTALREQTIKAIGQSSSGFAWGSLNLDHLEPRVV